jgi:hypothetical protein
LTSTSHLFWSHLIRPMSMKAALRKVTTDGLCR